MTVETTFPKTRRTFTLPARPEPLSLVAEETAVVVVDMQNAYASKGGYLDLAGFDVSGAEAAISAIATTLDAARAAGLAVVFLQNGWDPDYVEAGGPGSPNWHKSNALKLMRRQPELAGRFLAKGGWDYALVDRLTPLPGDIVVPKPRYSAFFNSQLDTTLRARGIRNIVFCGIATNVCVEFDPARRLPPRIFRHPARGRDPSGGSRLCPEGRRLQRRDLLRMGLRRRCVPPRPRADHPRTRLKGPPMTTRAIIPAGSAAPLAPYSPGMQADGAIYVSGTLAFDANNEVVHLGDAAAQTRHVLETIARVLEAAGSSMADVTFNHIFLTDWANYAAINAVYAEYFPGEKPARYCVQVGLVKPGALVEIATIAHKRS